MQTSVQANYQHQVPHHHYQQQQQQQHEKHHHLYYLSNDEPASLHDEVEHQEVAKDAPDDMLVLHQGQQEQHHSRGSGQEDSSRSTCYGVQYAAHFSEQHIDQQVVDQYEEVRGAYQARDDGPGLVYHYPSVGCQPVAATTTSGESSHSGQFCASGNHHVDQSTSFAYETTSGGGGQTPIDLSHHEHAALAEPSQVYYDLSAAVSVGDQQTADVPGLDSAAAVGRVPEQFTMTSDDLNQQHLNHDHYHSQLYSYPTPIGADTATAAIHTMIDPTPAMQHEPSHHAIYSHAELVPDLYAPGAGQEQQQYTHLTSHDLFHDTHKYEEQNYDNPHLELVAHEHSQYHSMHHHQHQHHLAQITHDNNVENVVNDDDDAPQHHSQTMQAPPQPPTNGRDRSHSAALSSGSGGGGGGGQRSSSSQCYNNDEDDDDDDLLDSDLESIDSQLTRDEKKAREANIPLSYHEIVNLSIEQFNEHIVRYPFSEAQLTLMKDIRRRGKNKVAAQTCRKRKMEQISELQLEVAGLANKRAALSCERARLSREHARLASEYEHLYTSIQSQLAAQAVESSNSRDQSHQEQVARANELNSSNLLVNVS